MAVFAQQSTFTSTPVFNGEDMDFAAVNPYSAIIILAAHEARRRFWEHPDMGDPEADPASRLRLTDPGSSAMRGQPGHSDFPDTRPEYEKFKTSLSANWETTARNQAGVPEPTTGLLGLPRTADDAVASATDAMQATRDRVSAAVTDAATSATASVKKRVGEEVDRVTADATQAFRGKAKAAAKAVGLGVAGERGELLGKTAEEEFEADKEDNPAPAPPPTGLLQTDADIRQLQSSLSRCLVADQTSALRGAFKQHKSVHLNESMRNTDIVAPSTAAAPTGHLALVASSAASLLLRGKIHHRCYIPARQCACSKLQACASLHPRIASQRLARVLSPHTGPPIHCSSPG
jgi:hypothetical protein